MLTLHVTPLPRDRVRISATRDGNPILLDTYTSDNERQRNIIGKKIGLDNEAMLQLTTEAVRAGVGVATERVIDENVGRSTVSADVYVRDRLASCRTHFSADTWEEAVRAALSHTDTNLHDPVVEWRDEESACFLDVDYHHLRMDERPSHSRLAFIMARIQPQPVLWFASRGMGVHALYLRRDGIKANVLACVGGFGYKALDPTAKFEVKSESRLPINPVIPGLPTSDIGVLTSFLRGGVTDSEVEDWLAARGLEPGQAYPHDRCPVAPENPSRDNPMWIGEAGVICKACEAKGIVFGSRRPGYFPYAALVGSHDLNEIARMVDSFTHWTHAQIVMESRCRLDSRVARLAYEGLLRLRFGDDPRVDRVFFVGEHMIRGRGQWVTPDRYETLKELRSTLATFPTCLNAEGKAIPERVDLMQQNIDLARYGYPSILPIYGVRIYGEYLGNDGGPVTLVLPPQGMSEPGSAPLRPCYVPENRRLPMDTAWERLERVFPGINRNYLLLLIAARGVAEGEIGIAPNIITVGPASTGKSQTVHIAASIVGDKCTEVPWNVSVERFRQGYMDGAERGTFVAVNELIKDATAAKKSAKQGFDVFLNLTADSRSHKMYVGPTAIGRLPVTVVTDTYVPNEVRADIQIGRRFVYVRLDYRIDWERSLPANQVGSPDRFRASSIDNAEASNAILSYVIDRWFRDRARTLTEIAAELGFETLEHCDEILDDPEALPIFFNEICKAGEWLNNPRLKGNGWKRIDFDDGDSTLSEAWRSVCDGVSTFEAFSSSRRVQETDWSTVVPVPIGTRCDVSRQGRSVAVRFRYGESRGRGNYQVNEQLLTCPGPRRTKEPDDAGDPTVRRDSDREPQGSGAGTQGTGSQPQIPEPPVGGGIPR